MESITCPGRENEGGLARCTAGGKVWPFSSYRLHWEARGAVARAMGFRMFLHGLGQGIGLGLRRFEGFLSWQCYHAAYL